MSEIGLVALTSGVSVLTLVIARIRCICRPCDDTGQQKCQSGCTDQPLQKDEHELDVSKFELNGRDIIVVTAKD